MKCSGCGHANPAESSFCLECGSRLVPACAQCGAQLPPNAKFCNKCGAPVQVSSARPQVSGPDTHHPTPTTQRDPLSYTPKHLADKILQSKSALEGERKQVTVLFADVKGSMELAEQLDPEEWHRILDRFFAILTDGVHRFEGTVNQYTGDGIMALFGAPIAHEDHAQRACYAALHLRDEIARYATEVKREHGVGFSTRMGINSGAVVVGRIGDDLRMDYTAQGHTVGLAQRMESLASPDTCYLTAATAGLVRGYFALDDLGDFRVKGVAEPVRVHRLTGIGTSRTRFDISRARGLSRFVGRAADIRTLEDAIAQTDAGNGQVVGVVAEAGTGKSRLCFEFLERCRARGMSVYEAHAVAHGKNIPLLPILELFRAYYGITSEDDDRSAREKIAGRMVLLDLGFADALPLIFDFLGVADSQRPAPRLDPDARQRQILAVMRKVIQSISEEQPTITLIEDLHWLDDASGEFLAHMVDARAGSRNLLLLNFRPEYRADWMQKSWYRQIPLTPLGKDAIAELLADLLGTDPSIATLVGPIHARTGGNPFFTEEVAQTLIESGHLEGLRGAYRLASPVEKLQVPATVQAVLAARIDRLPEREKRLLQVASVIGKDFAEPLLAEVAELPPEELKTTLAALHRAEFIYEQAIYPVVEYSFKHPLTQEVALGSQLKERRRQVHAAVARAIEQQHPDHLDERAPLLAHHWEEAGEALSAARWHRRAAEWVGYTDFAASTHHWGRVRALRRELPDDREAAALGIAACRLLLSMGWRVGMGLEEARTLLDEGQDLANASGDRRSALYLSMVYGRAVCGTGEVAAYLELMIETRRAALDLDDIALQAGAWGLLIDAFCFAARFPEALQSAEDGLARTPRSVSPDGWVVGINPYTTMSFWRGFCCSWMGRLPEAIEELGRCRRLCEEDSTPEMSGYALILTAEAHYHAHDAERALASARQLEEITRKLGEPPSLAAYAQLAFALAHLAAGRVADAIEAARSALDRMGRVEKFQAGMSAALLAEALLQAGDPSAALTAADEAIALCRRSERGNYEAAAFGVIARALLRRDGPAARDAAEAALASAAALIERTGATTLAPALCEWRAELAAALGDDATRERQLREARQGYEAIGAPGHVERLSALGPSS
ncbi:MAG TPA: adenylate/guanylate cyclase domain-containing protein [Candidatus Binatia bacterium]|nr:adenylate/guanylate cyclase domain-containing protein [Candidatus Binatia bacterium]